MREIVDPGEWQPVPPHQNASTIGGEIRKLERDIQRIAIDILGVMAEASWTVGSVELFRHRLETDAREVLAWVLAQVNPKDISLLDKGSIEAAIGREMSKWISRAEREFPPSWAPKSPAQSSPAMARDQDSDCPEPARTSQRGGTRGDPHLSLLETILEKRFTTLEKWAREHKLGRTTVFEWKSLRSAGEPLKGKVSPEKSAAIEKAIEEDAKTLGLTTRTDSD